MTLTFEDKTKKRKEKVVMMIENATFLLVGTTYIFVEFESEKGIERKSLPISDYRFIGARS